MSEDIKGSLVKENGILEFWFTLLTPPKADEELPDPPYILIRWIEAKPKGHRLLEQHAAEMVSQIRATLMSNRPVIFQPANGEMGNDESQAKIESYYRTCGFDYLSTSASKWWMTWPQPAAS